VERDRHRSSALRRHGLFQPAGALEGFLAAATRELILALSGRIRCIAKDSAQNRLALAGPARIVTDGSWHQIGCSRTGSTWRATVDSASTTKQASLGSISNTLSLAIGSNYGREDHTRGLIDDVQLTIG